MKRRTLINTIINILFVVAIGIYTLNVGIYGSAASNLIDDRVKPYIWPLFVIVGVIYIGLQVGQYLFSKVDDTPPDHLPAPSAKDHSRQRMIERVHTFWVKDVLDNVLHETPLIPLRLYKQPDVVANPWKEGVRETNRRAQLLPSGRSILQVYEDASGELLILGDPGSGKTTLLLELARDLLVRAQHDDAHPIPVVFNLSSWAEKRQKFTDWLVEELSIKYQVPRKLGQFWIENDQLLLLLDGLDEVPSEYLSVCIDTINTYRKDHGLVPMVVCSRKDNYLLQKKHVLLRDAIVVQPLTLQEINHYLLRAGSQWRAVYDALQTNTMLQEVVTTPLMLSVVMLAYQGKSLAALLGMGSPALLQAQIFAAYIARVFDRRGGKTRYTPQQTIRLLTWLARQLVQHNQTEFYIERMQPNWLPTGRKYHRTFQVVVRVSLVLVSGLISGLLMGLMGKITGLGGPFIGEVGGVVSGLVIGLTQRIDPEIHPAEALRWSWAQIWRGLAKTELLRNGVVVGLSTVLIVGGVVLKLYDGPIIGSGLIIGLISGLLSKVFSELLIEARGKGTVVITHQEATRSLQSPVLVGLVFGLLFWLMSGLLIGIAFALTEQSVSKLTIGVLSGLVFGLIGGLTFGLMSGLLTLLSHEMLSKHCVLVSLVSGLLLGLLGGLLLSLISGLLFGLAGGLIGALTGGLANKVLNNRDVLTRLVLGLLAAITSGLIFGLIMGLTFGLVNNFVFGLLTGLLFGLVGGVISGLVIGLTHGVKGLEIAVTDVVGWIGVNMWRRLVKTESLRSALIIGVTIGITYGLASGPTKGLVAGLLLVPISGVVFELIGRLADGLSSEVLDSHSLVTPNQGIWISARHSILVGLLFGVIGGVIFGLIGDLLSGSGWFFGLMGGTVSAVTVGLLSGGIACIQHVVLRFFLNCIRVTPWDYPGFLDYAAERVLLRKIGGGYIFIHRLLLEHFASLEDVSLPPYRAAKTT